MKKPIEKELERNTTDRESFIINKTILWSNYEKK